MQKICNYFQINLFENSKDILYIFLSDVKDESERDSFKAGA